MDILGVDLREGHQEEGPGLAKEVVSYGWTDEEEVGDISCRVGSGRGFGEGASGCDYGAACIVEVGARVASLRRNISVLNRFWELADSYDEPCRW